MAATKVTSLARDFAGGSSSVAALILSCWRSAREAETRYSQADLAIGQRLFPSMRV